MAKEVKTTYRCDVCGCIPDGVIDVIPQLNIQVIFTTEQTEGRSTKPYLTMETLDICSNCLNSVMDGNYLFGSGAQGYNKYNFKNTFSKQRNF